MLMGKSKIKDNYTAVGFTTPLKYKIVVQGVIDSNQSGYFSDMKIEKMEEGGVKNRTSLLGEVKDQSALIGVLNGLYNMHYIIISVKVDLS